MAWNRDTQVSRSTGISADESFANDLETLWAETLGDPRVVIAMLDGPVDLSHRSFEGADLRQFGASSRPHGPSTRHGTHVASIIFGQHNGPVRGISPRCTGISIPIFSDAALSSHCAQKTLAAAIVSAAEAGAMVVNISAGAVSDDGSIHPALSSAVELCDGLGVLLVAAAGDQGCCIPQIPSALPSVLAVADRLTPDTSMCCPNRHTNCISAPATAILGASPGGGILRASGTSYATAITSGLAALLLSLAAVHKDAPDPRSVGAILVESAALESSKDGTARMLNIPAARNMVEARANDTSRIAIPGPVAVLGGEGVKGVYPHDRWTVSEYALTNKFKAVSADAFGTSTIIVSQSNSYRVPEYHYPLDDRRLGMQLIPASDDPVPSKNWHSTPGYSILDAFLRTKMSLAHDAPIFAILSYIHPEQHHCNVVDLPRTSKLQLAYRHVGAYLGNGRTTHALPSYEGVGGDGKGRTGLNVDQHPANVHTIALEGVPQPILNQNAHLVDAILTEYKSVPRDADNMTSCRTVDLTTTLQYYRDTIRRADYLSELPWFTNCSLHKTIVINLMVNVPHNKRAFVEIFGEDGSDLWNDFKERYHAIHQTSFDESKETDFTPLWKLEGLNSESIRPLSLLEYHSYYAARDEDRLDDYPGRRPLANNIGLAWPLDTLADILVAFLDTYTPMSMAGGVVVAAELLLIGQVLKDRQGLSEWNYCKAIEPLLSGILAIESTKRGPFALEWLRTADREVRWLIDASDVRTGNMSLLAQTLRRSLEIAYEDTFQANRFEGRRVDVRGSLKNNFTAEISALRALLAAPGGRNGYFSGPAIFHQLSLGDRMNSCFVHVTTVCTVMDHIDLVEVQTHQTSKVDVK